MLTGGISDLCDRREEGRRGGAGAAPLPPYASNNLPTMSFSGTEQK